jgi:threonylcarbamoyladenosine tRNA methylthiotransferase MtaB
MDRIIKFAIHTLGCKVNQYESEKIIAQLKKLGWVLAPFPSTEADAHIINTCTVTAVANHKSRQLIRRAVSASPDGIVAVTGCYAESDKADIKAIDGVDLVVGNNEKAALPVLIADRLGLAESNREPSRTLEQHGEQLAEQSNEMSAERSSETAEEQSNEQSDEQLEKHSIKQSGELSDNDKSAIENHSDKMRTRALIKVQDGCVNFCTYCIVPYVRGELQFKPVEEVVEEARASVAVGAREIVLTGIHLGLYGRQSKSVTARNAAQATAEQPTQSAHTAVAQATQSIQIMAAQAAHYDSGQKTNLSALIKRLIEIPDIGRIRLSSIELNEVTPELVEIMSASSKLCNHLHIPLQSGSDNILKRMNRHYTTEYFVERINRLKQEIKDLAITTDIIVGFPGETESDFTQTIETVKAAGFSKLHVFKYSPRKGTPAAGFDGQIPNKVKDERSAGLIELGKQLSESYASQYLGKELEALIERDLGDCLSGISGNYIRVHCTGAGDSVGKIVKVAINKQDGEKLIGKVSM